MPAIMQYVRVPHDLAQLGRTKLPRLRVADDVVSNPPGFPLRNFRRIHDR